jgi:hypothetical protein
MDVLKSGCVAIVTESTFVFIVSFNDIFFRFTLYCSLGRLVCILFFHIHECNK